MSTETQTVEDTRPTNASVGALLGITHAHVSRLRYGTRLPSPALMKTIETASGWSISDQFTARLADQYASGFRKHFNLTDDHEKSE